MGMMMGMMGMMRKENNGSIKRVVGNKCIKRLSEEIHGFFLYRLSVNNHLIYYKRSI
jgi:hypothetical protein